MTESRPSPEEFQQARKALLRSAHHDAPAPKALARTMGALGLGVAVAAETAQAATIVSLAARLGLWKWLGMGVIAGVAVVGAYQAVQPVTPIAKVKAPVASNAEPLPAASSMPASAMAPRPLDAQEAQPVQAPTHRPVVVASPAQVPAEPSGEPPAVEDIPPAEVSSAPRISLDEEVANIDEARRALENGDSAGCLRALDRYSAQFPAPQLGQEAAILRVDAYARRGDCASALALAQRLIGTSPATPTAKRARGLLKARCGVELD